MAADIFRPGQWTDFFLLVGTGAVTLTGLVFVAMSLNLEEIPVDATHRYRAINTLTGLALVFMRCALVGAQNHHSIGVELFVVAGISGVVFGRGYVNALRTGSGSRLSRIVGGSLIHLAEMCGAALFFFGHSFGLYIAAKAIVANNCYMISAAWLLVPALPTSAVVVFWAPRSHANAGL